MVIIAALSDDSLRAVLQCALARSICKRPEQQSARRKVMNRMGLIHQILNKSLNRIRSTSECVAVLKWQNDLFEYNWHGAGQF